ncbi:MAG: extracellular solute-binding protein [Paenibacillaceae bacterium]|nr:extracellular solute-binding protein [Paenibacillaceae bacterium]
MTKKLLLLAAAFVLAIVAACSKSPAPSSGDAKGSPTPSASGAASASATPKKELRAKVATFEYADNPFSKGWNVWKYLSEGSGVTLEPVSVATNDPTEAYNKLFATKDLPDLMFFSNYDLPNKYGGDGALVNLLDHAAKMPNMTKWLQQFPVEAATAKATNGAMYVTPNKGIADGSRTLWMYREDVFKANNIAVPTTYDELYAVLKKLKQLYPDSYPHAWRFGLLGLDLFYTPNFQTGKDFYYNYDRNEWAFGPTEPNYKRMVEFILKLNQEKLIPPDWPTLDTNAWHELVSTNKAFIFQDYIARVGLLNTQFGEKVKGFKMNWALPLTGVPGGKGVNPLPHNFIGYGIAANSKNLDASLQYIDFLFSEKGRDLVSWGIKGETYTENGGAKKLNYPNLLDLRNKTGLSTPGTYLWYDFQAQTSMLPDWEVQMYKEQPKYEGKVQPKPALTKEESDIIATKGAAILKHKEENIVRFMLGTRPIGEWDQYVAEINKLGVADIVNIYKTAYERTQKK